MNPSRPRRMAGRFALAAWLAAIAAFGVLRFWTRVSRYDAADAIAWMWLVGGGLVGITAMVALVHALRHTERRPTKH